MKDLEKKSQEIRNLLIDVVSRNGGHLGPNLGVVELTLALKEVFDFEKDIILFDVGHQSYVYKILTDRAEKIYSLRKRNGISPFMDPEESSYDAFISGHAGTALGAAAGFATAHPDKRVVVIVGDASISNGHSLEAMNYIGWKKLKNIVVIMNNNDMSIGKNIGFISKNYEKIKNNNKYINLYNEINILLNKIKGTSTDEKTEKSLEKSYEHLSILTNLGFRHFGVVDGHDFNELITVLNDIKKSEGPCFVTANTIKGKGYFLAEDNKEKFHGIAPFDKNTGETYSSAITNSKVVGNKLNEMAEVDRDIYALSAGMVSGTGLETFYKNFPDRMIDSGISEGFLVTFSAALAKANKKPFVCIYSTFLQRAVSQLIHDVSLQNLPVRFIVDRSGIVGEDGKTHSGIYDTSFFMSIKNFVLLFPATEKELIECLEIAKDYNEGPIAIRISKSNAYTLPEKYNSSYNVNIGKWNLIKQGEKILFITVGSMLKEVVEIDSELIKIGINATIVSATSIKPLDENMLNNLVNEYEKIFVIEENYKVNSLSSSVLEFLNDNFIQKQIYRIGLEETVIPHGNRQELLKEYGLSGDRLINRIGDFVNGGKN